jgi:hypothetical protein
MFLDLEVKTSEFALYVKYMQKQAAGILKMKLA